MKSKIKKTEIYEAVSGMIGQCSWKEWVEPGHFHNFEAASVNTTALNKVITEYIWKLLKKEPSVANNNCAKRGRRL